MSDFSANIAKYEEGPGHPEGYPGPGRLLSYLDTRNAVRFSPGPELVGNLPLEFLKFLPARPSCRPRRRSASPRSALWWQPPAPHNVRSSAGPAPSSRAGALARGPRCGPHAPTKPSGTTARPRQPARVGTLRRHPPVRAVPHQHDEPQRRGRPGQWQAALLLLPQTTPRRCRGVPAQKEPEGG